MKPNYREAGTDFHRYPLYIAVVAVACYCSTPVDKASVKGPFDEQRARIQFEIAPGIMVIPEGSDSKGMVAVAAGFHKFCGRVINLTGRTLGLVALEISAFEKSGATLARGQASTGGPLRAGDTTSEDGVVCTSGGFAVDRLAVDRVEFQLLETGSP